MNEREQRAEAQIRPDIIYAWSGPSLLILDRKGRAGVSHLTGYYFRETRYLSYLQMLVNGEEPHLCSVARGEHDRLEFSFIYPAVKQRGGGGSGSGGSGRHEGILFRGLDLDMRCHLHPNRLELVLQLTNRWQDEAEIELGWELAADFCGLGEADEGRRSQEAPVERSSSEVEVHLRYLHPRLPFSTRVELEPGVGWTCSGNRVTGHLSLARQETTRIRLVIRPEDPIGSFDDDAARRRTLTMRNWQAHLTSLTSKSPNPFVFSTAQAARELGSLALLEGSEDEWLAPAAGMPLYPALFGRDALTATWQSALMDSGNQTRAVLTRLRRLQGTVEDEWRDEQPGRIIQQARTDPAARLGTTPFDRYYGDYASPLMFIIALAHLYAWSGDRRDLEDNWEAAQAALQWAVERGDRDGDGYLEYLTRSPLGPKHQGWKDSDNAIVDEHGEQVHPPLATCETQGYWYAALQLMSVLCVSIGDHKQARSLWRQARQLKESFNRDFWLEEEGYIAVALDSDKRPIRSLTSNAAQCITTGIVDSTRLPRLVDRLFQPDLFSGWGLRTLSSTNPSYNPLSYHLGSVWPVENGTIVLGLRRFGFERHALLLAKSIYDLAHIWEGGRTPESVGGYPRHERAHPGAYPRANAPQSWNNSALTVTLQAILGIRPFARLNLLLVDPILPDWLPEVGLQGIRVGNASVSLHFGRERNGQSRYRVLDRQGRVKVTRLPPLGSHDLNLLGRATAIVRALL